MGSRRVPRKVLTDAGKTTSEVKGSAFISHKHRPAQELPTLKFDKVQPDIVIRSSEGSVIGVGEVKNLHGRESVNGIIGELLRGTGWSGKKSR